MNAAPPARDPSDTLTLHRMILEPRSIFRQGVTLLRVAMVVLVLYLGFKIHLLIERILHRDTPA